MSVTKIDFIDEMLKNGDTPESIYQKALEKTREQERKKKEQFQKEIDRRRGAALKALCEYIELVTGNECSASFKQEWENDMKKIERGVHSEKPETRERKKNMRGEPLDPAFEKFLRDMGFLDS